MENTNTSKELLSKFLSNKTYENAYNYIIAFASEYRGDEGYYDYYNYSESKYSVFKLRYRGIISRFKFVESPKKNTFVFNASGKAVIEIPNGMYNSDKVSESVYKEIQERASEGIIRELKRKICTNIENFIPFADLNVVANIKWTLVIEEGDLD